jgi:hypothetical protein
MVKQKKLKSPKKESVKEMLLRNLTGKPNKYGEWKLHATDDDFIVINDMRAVMR